MITKNFIKMCEGAKQLQKSWKPKVGDYVWRKYTFFGEQMDEQFWDKDKMEEIIILTYASEVDGYFHATKDGETRIFDSHNEAHKKTCIYLPTQEQLQEMWQKEYFKNPNRHGWFGCFINFIDGNYKDDLIADEYFKDMTELWLAFVMKEGYNKSWTGEKWVKAE
ncbi:MAG: hypothetical protein KAW56_07060 [Candidatus Marinimicrobia bacterium]|nr:hypothetical protein [Candidatus Neomarinimicrobiota bacterium]